MWSRRLTEALHQPNSRPAAPRVAAPRPGRRHRWPGRWVHGSVLMLALLAHALPRPEAVHAAGSDAVAAPGPRHILLLSSWAEHLPWSRDFFRGVEQALHGRTGGTANLYVEYLDRSRLGRGLDGTEMARLLRLKYRHVNLDGIIVDAAPAIEFVLGHGVDSFGDIPFVLLPGGRIDASDLPTHSVIEIAPSVAETILLALEQHPGTRQLVLIGDQSPEPQAVLGEARRLLDTMAPGIRVRVLSDFTMANLQQRVSTLPDDTLILFTLVFQDRSGRRWRPVDVVERLARHASVPIYVLYDSLIGVGVVGGHVQSAGRVGKAAVQAIVDLATTPGAAASRRPDHAISSTVLDWRVLRRWDIPSSSIPADAELRYREPFVWEAYFQESLVALILIVTEAISILIIGTLYLQRHRLSRDLMQLNTQLESRIRERTAVLHRMTIIDDLTGLVNRKEFLARADAELQRFLRYRHGFSLAILDIDHFKSVNDTYGHVAGDKVLQDFASLLTTSLRAQDVGGRIGGEEFAILLPETELSAALVALEKIRHLTACSRFILPDGRAISLNVSIGVTACRTDDRSIKRLLQRADELLYRAKRGGRNRVVAELPVLQNVNYPIVGVSPHDPPGQPENR